MKLTYKVLIILVIFFISFFAFKKDIKEDILEFGHMEKEVILTTEDGVKIYGSYFQAEDKSAPAVILLHMMPSDRKSWHAFQESLSNAGFQSLSIDLRGHGESVFLNDKKIDYKNFTDKQQQEKIYDVKTAVDFFEKMGIKKNNISIVGASIGANLALWYQSENEDIKATVLMSPGMDYRGIKADEKMKKLKNNQNVFLMSGGDNDRYSQDSIKELFKIGEANKKIEIFENASHGTGIFDSDNNASQIIINWLKDIYF